MAMADVAIKTSLMIDFEQCELMPIIPNPGKIICVGHNYEEHRLETGRAPTSHPAVFLRSADSQVGHLQPVWIPKVSSQIDFEGELAVIIGRDGRYIEASNAGGHIAGYACYNDISVRDWQRHSTQFTCGKISPEQAHSFPGLLRSTN